MSAKEIREITSDCMALLKMIRSALDTSSLWLDTICFSRDDLAAASRTDPSYVKRSKVFTVLGLSLGDVLDKRNLPFIDFIRALALVTQELDSYSLRDTLPQAQISLITRKEKTKRSLFSRSGEEYTLLNIPHFAFTPDYLESLHTLLDILYEVHNKLLAHATTSNQSRDFGLAIQDPFIKFNHRVRKILIGVQRDLESLARTKIDVELDSVLAKLITF